MTEARITHCIILAAGVGRRLMPLTADRPKALMQLSEDVSLLQRLVCQCREVGLEEVIIVTGHRHDAVVAWRERWRPRISLRLVYNPEFECANNARSLLAAQAALDGRGFVKLDGDVVLHSEILRRLLQSSEQSALVIDRGVALGNEEMKVQLTGEATVAGLGKWLDPTLCAGESIGVEKVAPQDVGPLFDALERAVISEGQADAYYEDVYHQRIGEGWRLGAVDTGGLPWTEVDTPEDLRCARDLVARLDEVPA